MAAARVLFKFGLIEQPWKDTPTPAAKPESGRGGAAEPAEPSPASQ
jgi:hypothetical protein